MDSPVREDAGRLSGNRRGYDAEISMLGNGGPGKMGQGRLRLHPCGLARCGAIARTPGYMLAPRDKGYLRLHRMGGSSGLEHGQDRDERHLVLCRESVARRRPAAAAPG